MGNRQAHCISTSVPSHRPPQPVTTRQGGERHTTTPMGWGGSRGHKGVVGGGSGWGGGKARIKGKMEVTSLSHTPTTAHKGNVWGSVRYHQGNKVVGKRTQNGKGMGRGGGRRRIGLGRGRLINQTNTKQHHHHQR